MKTPRGALAAAAGIALSRLSGLVRAVVVTNVLGLGTVGDAFAAAQRIPNVLQNLLGEGSLSAALVPAYSSEVDEDPARAGQLAGAVATFLLALTSVIVLIGVIAARPLTRAIAWGFEGEQFDLAVRLVRITVIGSGLLVMSAWCLALLNSHRRFFVGYVAPVVWNLVQITTVIVVVLAGWMRADIAVALAWAMAAGALLQVAVQLPSVRRINRTIRLARPDRDPLAKSVIRRLGPAVLGRGALQLSAFADLALASLLAVGATAALFAAQTLYILPLSIIGISVVAAELPELSRLSDTDPIARRIEQRLLETTYLITGVVVVYLTAGTPLVDSLFNVGGLRDRIDTDDLRVVAYVLGAYSLGLPALVASRLLQNVSFAAGDTSTPARIAVVRIVVSFGIGAAIMFPLDRVLVLDGALSGFGDLAFVIAPLDDAVRLDPDLPSRLGPVGLALAAAIGAWVEFALLRSRVLGSWNRDRLVTVGLRRHLVPPTLALIVGLTASVLLPTSHPVLRLIVVGGLAAGTHLVIGSALQCRGADQLTSALRRRGRTATETGEDPSP